MTTENYLQPPYSDEQIVQFLSWQTLGTNTTPLRCPNDKYLLALTTTHAVCTCEGCKYKRTGIPPYAFVTSFRQHKWQRSGNKSYCSVCSLRAETMDTFNVVALPCLGYGPKEGWTVTNLTASAKAGKWVVDT